MGGGGGSSHAPAYTNPGGGSGARGGNGRLSSNSLSVRDARSRIGLDCNHTVRRPDSSATPTGILALDQRHARGLNSNSGGGSGAVATGGSGSRVKDTTHDEGKKYRNKDRLNGENRHNITNELQKFKQLHDRDAAAGLQRQSDKNTRTLRKKTVKIAPAPY